jgi:hypothetical protein
LRFQVAQTALALATHGSDDRVKEDRAIVEALQLSHELDRVAVVRKKLQKEVKAQVKWNQKLHGDPKLVELRRRRQQVSQDEKDIEQLVLANADALRRLQHFVLRRGNEVSLLEGELASLARRVDLATVYTTDSAASAASEVEDIPETVNLDLGIAFDVPLF